MRSGPVGQSAVASWMPRRVDYWWVWFGLHGGAGVTTLSHAVPGGVDFMGAASVRLWLNQVASDAHDGGHASQRPWPDLPAVGVCRSHMAGLEAAQKWAAWTTAHEVPVIGLVVVADAPGRLPRPLEAMIRLISGGYVDVWQMPWVKEWRLGEVPNPDNTPPVYRHLQQDLMDRVGAWLGPGEMQTGGT